MMALRRSDSFTRSSPTSWNTVMPRAWAATRASTGISSMTEAMCWEGISQPRSTGV